MVKKKIDHKLMKSIRDAQKADAKIHKKKHKLFEKEEKLSEKEEKLHKRAEKAEKRTKKDPKHHKKSTRGKSKVEKVMREYSEGKLHSGSKKGPQVKSRKQAIAIALSEARKAGAHIPKKKRK